MHGPFTAAIVGFQISMPDSKVLIVGHSQNEPGNSPVAPAGCLRSTPAQKALPAPVTIATQAWSSPRKVSHAMSSAWRISAFTALRERGRL